MEITTAALKPFERVFIDIVGKLPKSINDFEYLLTIQDDFIRFAYAVPIYQAISDNGQAFISEILKELKRLYGFRHTFTPYWHLQGNNVESYHSTLKEYIRHYKYIDRAIFSYNTRSHTFPVLTPFWSSSIPPKFTY